MLRKRQKLEAYLGGLLREGGRFRWQLELDIAKLEAQGPLPNWFVREKHQNISKNSKSESGLLGTPPHKKEVLFFP